MTKAVSLPSRLTGIPSHPGFRWFRFPGEAGLRAAAFGVPHVYSQKRKIASPIPSSLGKQRPGLSALLTRGMWPRGRGRALGDEGAGLRTTAKRQANQAHGGPSQVWGHRMPLPEDPQLFLATQAP